MFLEGVIFYFTPFYFKNGNTAKQKYFVVLKNNHKSILIALLPTSKNFIPINEQNKNGCIDLPDKNLNCFVFLNNLVVTECGKRFERTTHLYGHQMEDYNINDMLEIYPNEGRDYIIWGKMKSTLFNELLNCFKNSKSVKNKYRKLL